jgi:hypothetical protein
MSEPTCRICGHPPHDGRRCTHEIADEVSVPHKGLVFTRYENFRTCSCGRADALLADFDAVAEGHNQP